MEIRENEERYLIAFALAAFMAALIALPMLAMTAQAAQWIHQGSFLGFGELLGRFRPLALVAFALVGGTVTYTIVQESIVLLGRCRAENPTPVTLLVILVPLSVLMGWMCQICEEIGNLGRVRYPDSVGFLVPGLLFYSAISSPAVVPSILLRFGMSRAQGVGVPLIYVAGLAILGLIWQTVVRMGGSNLSLQLQGYVFLFAAAGFLAGGLSQLLVSSGQESEAAELPPEPPKPVPKVDDYRREATEAWSRLWVVYNAVLLVEGVIAMGYVFFLIRKASYVESRLTGGICAGAFFFAVAANICFLLGPFIDSFLYNDTGVRLGRGRYVLFALGLLCGMLIILECAFFARHGGLIRF